MCAKCLGLCVFAFAAATALLLIAVFVIRGSPEDRVCVGMTADEVENTVGRAPDSAIWGIGADDKKEICSMWWHYPDGSGFRVDFEGQTEPLVVRVERRASTETAVEKLLRWLQISPVPPEPAKIEL